MLAETTELNDGNEKVSAKELTEMVNNKSVKVSGFFDHTKASERYAVITVKCDGIEKEWYVPYFYRRTNLFIDTKEKLAEYIKLRLPLLCAHVVEEYKATTAKTAKPIIGNASDVTWPIFKKLLSNCGKWVWNKDFGSNSNPQRRIQAIKEFGYTLATKIDGKKTYHQLLPFDRVVAPTYETIPPKVRKEIFKALGGIDAFSGNAAALSSLPDHKFPEIRWEAATPESNENLTESDMRDKFQLVPEWVNQMKREICRKCFQTGYRGKLNGIDFFYHWGDKWPSHVPTMGIAAKVGCIGCFWYDMMEWRKQLNNLIKESNKK